MTTATPRKRSISATPEAQPTTGKAKAVTVERTISEEVEAHESGPESEDSQEPVEEPIEAENDLDVDEEADNASETSTVEEPHQKRSTDYKCSWDMTLEQRLDLEMIPHMPSSPSKEKESNLFFYPLLAVKDKDEGRKVSCTAAVRRVTLALESPGDDIKQMEFDMLPFLKQLVVIAQLIHDSVHGLVRENNYKSRKEYDGLLRRFIKELCTSQKHYRLRTMSWIEHLEETVDRYGQNDGAQYIAAIHKAVQRVRDDIPVDDFEEQQFKRLRSGQATVVLEKRAREEDDDENDPSPTNKRPQRARTPAVTETGIFGDGERGQIQSSKVLQRTRVPTSTGPAAPATADVRKTIAEQPVVLVGDRFGQQMKLLYDRLEAENYAYMAKQKKIIMDTMSITEEMVRSDVASEIMKKK